MNYRKWKADLFFTGENFLNNDSVLITNEQGEIIDIASLEDAGDEIQTFRGILLPGFINAHCHLELSHLKNKIPEKTGLVNFVFKVVTERHYEEEMILEAIKKGEQEMIQNGIVAAGDICNNSLSLSQKAKKNLFYYNFIETSGWHPEVSDLRFQKAKKIFDEFDNHDLVASIVPHAPYSVSENLWNKMIPSFIGKTISIHNQESAQENLFFEKGEGDFIKMYEMMNIDNTSFFPTGKKSIQNYFEKLSSANSVILVHNTFTDMNDLNFIMNHKNKDQIVSFCFCPNANLFIENALPDINLFLEKDLNIVLGTDSLASNHQLNILEEMKTIAKHFPNIKTENLLKWATLNGAMALQFENKLGSFVKGKTPGVILIENVNEGKITGNSSVRRLI